jgi:hypothetical protein
VNGRWAHTQALPSEPCYHGFTHPFFSCIAGASWHAVLSARISEEEWAKITEGANSTWNGKDFDLEGLAALIAEVRPDAVVISIDRLPRVVEPG